jgi:HSP20 family protein
MTSTIARTAAEKVAVRKSVKAKPKTTSTPAPFEHGFGGEIARLREEIDRTFDRVFHGWPEWPHISGRFFEPTGIKGFWGPAAAPRFNLMPSVDVGETDKAFEITAELPGMDEDDIEVTLTDAGLTIKGEKKSEREETEKDYHRLERSFGSFQRCFAVPEEVDAAKIDARFKKGVLTVTLPKTAKAKAKARKIKVKAV